MLLPLIILQLLLPLAFTVPSVDHWDAWGPYGECSRSCGSGVTMRTRRCITQRTDGGHNCIGPDKSYRSCNIQDCPDGSRDFREEQCSQFDGTDFQGKRYKWLPYYGAENPCELNCMPRGENFYYRHRSAVVDGTACHPGRRDVCVGGVCKRLGCDNILESQKREDPCLQCGGNGQTCHSLKNTFTVRNLPTGYNQMFIIPVGATTISIRERVPTRNYLAIKNLRGEYYLNGHWVIEFSKAAPIGGTMMYYQRGAEGENIPESIVGRGPTTEPLVIELISQEPNQGVEYEYYLPNGRSREGYYWSYGSWSPCSKECGSGFQSRLVFCTIDNEVYPDYLCASLPRPQSNRTCNTQQCPQIHSWRTGEWNVCSVSCGGGSQLRTVQCMSHDASGPRVVEDAVCAAYADAPPSLRTCNMHKCAEYRVTGWSACSVSCGSGEQSREVTCVGSGGMLLQETSCRTLLRPPSMQPCEMPACPRQIRWHVGEWGLCTKSCASGTRQRQVVCSDQGGNLYAVSRCSSQRKPSSVERCNTQSCFSSQVVPSLQDPRGHDSTQTGFRPFVPDLSTARRPETRDPTLTNTVQDPHSSAPALHCSQSHYGCCPDQRTPARGPHAQGCPLAPAPTPAPSSCIQTSYGCCEDGMTAAQGPNKEGCVEFVALAPTVSSLPTENAIQCRTTTYGCCFDRTSTARGPNGEGCPNPPNNIERSICSLPRAAGSCSSWVSRYHFDIITSKCAHFWYGGCHGNSNNFMTRAECQRACQVPVPSLQRPLLVATPGNSTSSSSASSTLPSDRGIIRVHGGAHDGSRPGTSAATNAHRGRVYLGGRRPATRAQLTGPAASLTLEGVRIDKSDPDTVEALVGQTVVLPCRVSPPPSSTVVVEWRRDGNLLSTQRHHQQPGGSLLVGPLIRSDSGWFLCLATRERERDHRYIYLAVSEGPSQIGPNPLPKDGPIPRFSIDPSTPSTVEKRTGQTVRLPCTIVPPAALQSVSVQWTKDGQTMRNSRVTQHPDGSLLIVSLTSDDSGIYTCTAASQQQLEQRQLQLLVRAELKITTAPDNIQVTEGSSARLPCVVSGDNVSIGWSRNGVPVHPDGQSIFVSSDGSLILNTVKTSDEGTYTCNAYTGIYSVSATADVKVIKNTQGVNEASDCADQPELANCKLIVYARLCTNQYYSSFCCASCARHAQSNGSLKRHTLWKA